MSVLVVDSADQFDEFVAKAGGKLVVVDFTATWCGPCRAIKPCFEKLSSECTEVVFLQVDVDDIVEVTERFSVNSMPTFVFIRNGKEVSRFSGANAGALEEKIKSLM